MPAGRSSYSLERNTPNTKRPRSPRDDKSEKRRHYDDPPRSRDAPAPSTSYDDKDGHYIVKLGEGIGQEPTPQRYKVLSVMGEGTFGKVVEAWDREKRKYLAVKIIRNVPKYRDAAFIEIDILRKIRERDPHGRSLCIPFSGWFDFRNHVCMMFPKMGQSLYDFLRNNDYTGFSIPQTQHYARQLLKAVNFCHSMRLVHTDLKPENILFQSEDTITMTVDGASIKVPTSHDIAVIDFGSATFEDQHHTAIVSTRHYRAPEVVLGLGWSYACDVWSVGCILIELVTGDALFQTHANLEHLAMMERVFGPIPKEMVRRADRHASKYFNSYHELRYPDEETSRSSQRAVRKLLHIEEMFADRAGGSEFRGCVSEMLQYDVHKRPTCAESLKHPFFSLPLEDDRTRACLEPPCDLSFPWDEGDGVRHSDDGARHGGASAHDRPR